MTNNRTLPQASTPSEPIWLPRETRIGPSKTVADWLVARRDLRGAGSVKWEEIFHEFFEDRLEGRYLQPIKTLQESCVLEGEGFSIVTIQCSLVEFLEATRQGKNYRKVRRKSDLGEHEYGFSSDMFVSFLNSRQPFADFFDEDSAGEFYVNVRCGLLHEARTKGGWLIRASDSSGRIVDSVAKIIYRNNFQSALERYISTYRAQIKSEADLQEAFIRKFDDLCSYSDEEKKPALS